jgi:hypothetical protein
MCRERRGDLVVRRLVRLDEREALEIPGGGEPLDAAPAAVAVDLVVVLAAQLEAFLLLACRRPPRALARRVELLLRVDDVDRPLLELDGIATGVDRDVDQLFRDLETAVVVDPDFRDDVAVGGWADQRFSSSVGARASPTGEL